MPRLLAAVGSTRWLATNTDKFAGLNAIEGFQDLWNQRPELLDAVRFREHQNDADVRGAEVLLKLKVPVYGQQRIESGRHHQSQELAVLFRRPSHVDDVAHVVPDQISLERTGHTLIEEQKHELRSFHGRVRAPRPLAPD